MAEIVTISLLRAIIREALKAPGVNGDTQVVLPSDEEGNQMHFCYSWGIEHHLIEDPKKKHEWIDDPTKEPVLILWPSDEEWEQ